MLSINHLDLDTLSLFLKILFIYFQREGKGGRKRERETSVCGAPLTGGLAHNPGMYLDWELNQQPLVCRLMFNPLSHPRQHEIF